MIKRQWPYLVAALLVLVLVLGFIVHRRSQSHPTLQVIGTLTLNDSARLGAAIDNSGANCTGAGQFKDVAVGEPVRIVDSAGHTTQADDNGLSIGHTSGAGTQCLFYFAIEPLGGRRYYDVIVGNRTAVRFTQDQLHDLELTLGH